MQIITMLNPLSSQHHALEDFKSLKTSQKIITIAVTIIAALATLLIGTAAIFRLLVNHYVRKVDANKPNKSIPGSEDGAEVNQQTSPLKLLTLQRIPSGRSLAQTESTSAPIETVAHAISQNTNLLSTYAAKETKSASATSEGESSHASSAEIIGGLRSSTLHELKSLTAMLDNVEEADSLTVSEGEGNHQLDGTGSTDETNELNSSATFSILRRYVEWLDEVGGSGSSTVSDEEGTHQIEDLSTSSESFVETSESASSMQSSDEIETFEFSHASDLQASSAEVTFMVDPLVSDTKDFTAAAPQGDQIDEPESIAVPPPSIFEMSDVVDSLVSIPKDTGYNTPSQDQAAAEVHQSACSKIDSEKNMDDQAAVSSYASDEEPQDGIDQNVLFENKPSDVTLFSLQKRISQSLILANTAGSGNNVLTSASISAAVTTPAEPVKELLIESSQAARACVMAALAGHLANEIQEAENTLLSPLPSPANLGIEIPYGIYAQTYRSGNEVIVALQCPQVTESYFKNVQDAVKELQISPHQSDDDLNQAVAKVNSHLKQMHGYELKEELLSLIITTNTQKILPAAESPGYEIIAGAGQGAKLGGAVASAFGTATATGLVVAGVAAPPVAAFIAGACALTGLAGGAATGLVKEGVKRTVNALKKKGSETTLPTLQTAVKALNTYLLALKQNQIGPNDTIVTTGSTMGGVLSALVGAVHSHEAYCFNSEGILTEGERGAVLENCGLKRQAAGVVEYKNLSIDGELSAKPLQLQPNQKTVYLDAVDMGMQQKVPVVLLDVNRASLVAAH